MLTGVPASPVTAARPPNPPPTMTTRCRPSDLAATAGRSPAGRSSAGEIMAVPRCSCLSWLKHNRKYSCDRIIFPVIISLKRRSPQGGPAMSRMDAIDRKILAVLQADASLSVAEIGQRVGLSSTPCWKRIQRLEADGVIQKRVALVDADKLGLGVTVFFSMRTRDHSQEWLSPLFPGGGALCAGR